MKAKFIVNPYVKGSVKTFILGPVEDILTSLDDTSLNLQNMSGSRFIGPFLRTVSKWEKALSHISEVLDVSMKDLSMSAIIVLSAISC